MGIFSKFFHKLRVGSLSASDWEELERSLLESDLGPALTTTILNAAKKVKVDDAQSAILGTLQSCLSTTDRALAKASNRPTTILVVGVNGTGKTTSTAKLMKYLKDQRASVIVAAADTFRAAATEQIQTWGDRLGILVVAGKQNSDPAAVAFDSVTQAKSSHFDYLIVDTAGRLHTKSGLMDELGKIKRVIEKVNPVDEVLLVVDATTGQNGIAQAKSFIESVHITGIILTKMDGSAKGGIALAIEAATGIPVKFVGNGESAEDLSTFQSASYLEGLIS